LRSEEKSLRPNDRHKLLRKVSKAARRRINKRPHRLALKETPMKAGTADLAVAGPAPTVVAARATSAVKHGDDQRAAGILTAKPGAPEWKAGTSTARPGVHGWKAGTSTVKLGEQGVKLPKPAEAAKECADARKVAEVIATQKRPNVVKVVRVTVRDVNGARKAVRAVAQVTASIPGVKVDKRAADRDGSSPAAGALVAEAVEAGSL